MIDIPRRFEINLDVKLKDFIPKELNPKDKKRIREALRSVKLTHQIAGEEIPSLVNNEHRCQVIQFYEIEVGSIKDVNYIASIYQNIIKPLCVIRVYDSKEEVYSFADKRLSQTVENQIVVEDAYISQKYPYGLPGEGIDQYIEYLSFKNVKNKTDKLSFYRECMYKMYLLEHRAAFADVDMLLNENIWYSAARAVILYHKYAELVKAKNAVSRAQINVEKIKANKEVKVAKEALDQEIQKARGR